MRGGRVGDYILIIFFACCEEFTHSFFPEFYQTMGRHHHYYRRERSVSRSRSTLYGQMAKENMRKRALIRSPDPKTVPEKLSKFKIPKVHRRASPPREQRRSRPVKSLVVRLPTRPHTSHGKKRKREAKPEPITISDSEEVSSPQRVSPTLGLVDASGGGGDPKRFCCDRCPITCTTRSNLRRHKKSQHLSPKDIDGLVDEAIAQKESSIDDLLLDYNDEEITTRETLEDAMVPKGKKLKRPRSPTKEKPLPSPPATPGKSFKPNSSGPSKTEVTKKKLPLTKKTNPSPALPAKVATHPVTPVKRVDHLKTTSSASPPVRRTVICSTVSAEAPRPKVPAGRTFKVEEVPQGEVIINQTIMPDPVRHGEYIRTQILQRVVREIWRPVPEGESTELKVSEVKFVCVGDAPDGVTDL